MNLTYDLVVSIKEKLVYQFLQPKFDTPLQNLNQNTILLATKWQLLSHFLIDEDTLPLIAEKGHLETVKWLYKNAYKRPFVKIAIYASDWSDYPIDMAAYGGHLDIVEWLYSVGEGYTTFAMDYAAINGHLDVVRWLHSKGASCTKLAFDGAASAGNLEILKWLAENRHEGCSNSIFKNNDEILPSIYKFVLKRYPYTFHPNVIVMCARRGDLETLQELWQQRTTEWTIYTGNRPNGLRFYYTTSAYVEAGKAGHVSVVLWFIQNRLIV